MPATETQTPSCDCTPSCDHIDQMFRAFSDRTRLRILHLLLDGEFCVGDIVQILQTAQPKVSRHLAHLRNAGLVSDRREGLWMYYCMAQPDGKLGELLVDLLKKGGDEFPMMIEDQQALVGLAECSQRYQQQLRSDGTTNIQRSPAAVDVPTV